MKRFKITDPEGKESFWSLVQEGDSLSIGRSGDCDIVLPGDMGMSRFHCCIQYCNGDLVLQDCHSRNGIYEDGVRVERVVLRHGHTYSMGMSFLFAEPDEKPEKNPVRHVAQPSHPAPMPAARVNKRVVAPSAATAIKPRPSGRGNRVMVVKAKELLARSEDAVGMPNSFRCVLALQVPPQGFCGGACLQFRFRAAEKCYLHLVQIDSHGAVTHLVGNGGGDNTVLPGVDTSFPSLQDGECDFVVAPPYGNDAVLALACTAPRDISHTLRERASSGVSDPLALARAVILDNSPMAERWSCALLRIVSRER